MDGVRSHHRVFLVGQLGRFFQDIVRDRHLAHVVEHRRDPQGILGTLDLALGQLAVSPPLFEDLDRIGADPVDMVAGLLGIPELGHADHPQDDLPGHHRAFDGDRGIVGEEGYVHLVAFGEGGEPFLADRFTPGFFPFFRTAHRVDDLDDADHLVPAGLERDGQDRSGAVGCFFVE